MHLRHAICRNCYFRWKQTNSRLDICKLAQLTIYSKLKADGMVWILLIVTCYEQKQEIHRYFLFHKKSLCYNAFVERSIYWVKCVCKVINVLSNATKMINIEAQQHINMSKTDLGLICISFTLVLHCHSSVAHVSIDNKSTSWIQSNNKYCHIDNVYRKIPTTNGQKLKRWEPAEGHRVTDYIPSP